MLTKGLDNIPGTAGDDLIIGSVDAGNPEMNTLSALDIINGGDGIDTLRVATNAAANIPLANISKVEIIEIQGANAGGTIIDTTSLTGVTNLNITKTAGAINADAGATTDVSVAVATAAATAVDGGKNVTVALTDVVATSTVAVGGATAAKGTVTVGMTGKASVAGTDATLGAVTVTGGTSISVTQKAASDSSAAAADTAGATITQGPVTVNGDASTTTVSVKQDAAVAEVKAVAGVALKAATQEVTFTEAKLGDTITLRFDNVAGAHTLTFTAKKDLTAAEVASAFANLAANVNQGNASATLGIYTDVGGTNGWTSGAVQTVSATASKVVFSKSDDVTPTAVENNIITATKTGTVTVPTVSAVTDGVAAVTAKTGVLGVDNGAVVIEDSGTGVIKTITVDGYANGSTIGAVTATAALETLTLNKPQGTASMTVADTAATLTLNLQGHGTATNGQESVLTLTAAPTTLNVVSTGDNYVDLTAAATETLNVSGTGLLNVADVDLAALKTVTVTGTAGLVLSGSENNTLTSVTTTGTTGAVTATINGDAATYAGGAGADSVTIANPTVAISKSIKLGAGNDRLDLSAGTPAMPTVLLEGGEGTDTLVLTSAAAASLSAGTTFETKIDSFERLEVKAVAASTDITVNLENLDDIDYVITKGGVAAVANVFGGSSATAKTDGGAGAELSTVTLDLAGNALLRGQSVTVDGVTVTATAASMTEEQVIDAFTGTVVDGLVVTGSFATPTGWTGTPVAAKASASTFTLTNTVAGNVGDYTTAPAAGATGFSSLLKLDKVVNNATVQMDAGNNLEVVLKDATGGTDVVNLIANGNTDLGVATVAGVETIKITVNDSDTSTNVSTDILTLSANKAGTIDVAGAGNLTLTLASTATEVTLIDASTATGKLVVATLASDTAATTVKGGLAADTLTAVGANDVLQGNAGNDTLKVTTGTAVTLSGGDGIDAFDVSGYKGTVGGAATITDLAKGETLKFVSNAAADFNSAKVTLIAEATFTEYVAEAMKVASANGTVTHGVAWFQFTQGGATNTFVVQNIGADNSFADGTDIIVKLTGAVDLSASSFNDTGAGTLLYI